MVHKQRIIQAVLYNYCCCFVLVEKATNHEKATYQDKDLDSGRPWDGPQRGRHFQVFQWKSYPLNCCKVSLPPPPLKSFPPWWIQCQRACETFNWESGISGSPEDAGSPEWHTYCPPILMTTALLVQSRIPVYRLQSRTKIHVSVSQSSTMSSMCVW